MHGTLILCFKILETAVCCFSMKDFLDFVFHVDIEYYLKKVFAILHCFLLP